MGKMDQTAHHLADGVAEFYANSVPILGVVSSQENVHAGSSCPAFTTPLHHMCNQRKDPATKTYGEISGYDVSLTR